MRKLMFVVAFCFSIIIANAQSNQGTTKEQGTKNLNAIQKPTTIKEADLMKPIKDDLVRNFAGAKVEKAFKLDIKGVTTYKVMITTKENQKMGLTYDQNGKFMKKAEPIHGKNKSQVPK